MNDTLKNKAFHEAGHVILMMIFRELFEIEFATIDSSTSTLHLFGSGGGVKAKLKTKPENLMLAQVDEYCLASLAGFAVDLHRDSDIQADYYKSFDAMYARLHGNNYAGEFGDLSLFNRGANEVCKRSDIHFKTYFVKTVTDLVIVIQDPDITSCLDLVAAEFLAAPNKTFSGQGLNTLLKRMPLDTWINTKRQQFQHKREKLLQRSLIRMITNLFRIRRNSFE